MSDDQIQTEAQAETPAGPALLYRTPEPLSAAVHGGWRLREGDYGFAAETPWVPIVVAEIAHAMRDCPIVFSALDAHPVAVMGVENDNLFITGGQWAQDSYVPAYLRRYPFGFIPTINPEGFALGIDVRSERIAQDGEEGVPLFEGGEPSELTRQALAFCDAFRIEAVATRAFAEALLAEGLLVDRRADVTLPDGTALGLTGFQIIDAEKLAALPDARIVEWHRNGWLAFAQFHLASLNQFQALLGRRAARHAVLPA